MSNSTHDPDHHAAGSDGPDTEAEVLLRGFRLMAVYEHLRRSVDWMSAELEAQQRLLATIDDQARLRAIHDDAVWMTHSIAFQRDRAAEVVSAIFGESAFKTGRVQQIFYQAIDAIDAKKAGE